MHAPACAPAGLVRAPGCVCSGGVGACGCRGCQKPGGQMCQKLSGAAPERPSPCCGTSGRKGWGVGRARGRPSAPCFTTRRTSPSGGRINACGVGASFELRPRGFVFDVAGFVAKLIRPAHGDRNTCRSVAGKRQTRLAASALQAPPCQPPLHAGACDRPIYVGNEHSCGSAGAGPTLWAPHKWQGGARARFGECALTRRQPGACARPRCQTDRPCRQAAHTA